MHVKISYDVDGILADYIKSAANRLGREVQVEKQFYIEWVKPIHDELEQDLSFWANLPTMIKPDEILHYIECYITAIQPHIKDARVEWLLKNGYQNRPVYVTQEKDKLINELGINIHVDDKLSTITDIRDNCPDCTPILYLPWYLRYENIPDDIIVIYDVESLNAKIQELSVEYAKNNM